MLCGRILEAHGDQVWVGGNIGQPLIEQVEAIPPTGKVVLELSSFQLEELGRSPHLSIVTNITPNHLDQHASMAEYIEAKQHIYRYQAPGDACILNYDDPTTRAMAQDCPGRVAFFSRQAELAEGAFVRDDELLLRWNGREERLCARRELKLIGEHNVENVLAASLAAYLFGAQTSAIHAAVTTFTGAPHRLEFVREVGGVRYYNDSIATTPNRAMAALHSFASPIVLIAGGYDKKLPFDDFARLAVQKVRAMVVLGVTAGLIEAAVQQAAAEAGVRGPLLLKATSFDEAVMLAARQATPGDVVLLSPACASYDMFHNFEERGQRFRDLVRGL
jgi:UDP-N-acetylmuramoylalanine--D-glutamate ligase